MRTINRAIAVLESFSAEHPILALREIARKVGLAKSTTSRIVRALEDLGYVVRLDNDQFCLSVRIFKLATAVKKAFDVRAASRPEMERLANRLHETITLSALVDGKRERIDVVNKLSPIRRPLQAGEQGPLSTSATSLVLMAFADENTRNQVLPLALRLNGLRKKEMAEKLARVCQQGYAVSHSAATRGLSAIAAPIQGFRNDGTYSLAVCGLTTRLLSRLPEITYYTLEATKRISLRLGGPLHELNGQFSSNAAARG